MNICCWHYKQTAFSKNIDRERVNELIGTLEIALHSLVLHYGSDLY